MQYVRLDQQNRVVELIQETEVPIQNRFHPNFVSQLLYTSDDVQLGWILVNGELIPNEASVISEDEYFEELRSIRNSLLSKSDYTVLPDSPFDEELKAAWITYRQALRELPESVTYPEEVEWPVKPA